MSHRRPPPGIRTRAAACSRHDYRVFPAGRRRRRPAIPSVTVRKSNDSRHDHQRRPGPGGHRPVAVRIQRVANVMSEFLSFPRFSIGPACWSTWLP